MSEQTQLCPCCGRPLPRGSFGDTEGGSTELRCEIVFSGGRVFTADELLEVLREDVGLLAGDGGGE